MCIYLEMVEMREKAERICAHMALYGWRPVYGAVAGTVGFWNDDTASGVGVYFRETVIDPDGDNIGAVTTLGRTHFKAPVKLEDVPLDILHKIARFTKVPPL